MDIQEKHKWYNAKFFKRVAPAYDYVEFIIAGLRKQVAQKITVQKAKILDMACGTGNQSIAFAKNGHSVIGVDLSPDMLKYAEKKIKPGYDVKFIRGDAAEIDFEDSVFDASSISLALHDMPEEIGIMILKEMKRTTKKDGQIIIIDYYTPSKRIGTKLGHLIAKIWESKYYDHFRHVGLEYYLDQANLKTKSKKAYLFNNFQIVECANEKTEN